MPSPRCSSLRLKDLPILSFPTTSKRRRDFVFSLRQNSIHFDQDSRFHTCVPCSHAHCVYKHAQANHLPTSSATKQSTARNDRAWEPSEADVSSVCGYLCRSSTKSTGTTSSTKRNQGTASCCWKTQQNNLIMVLRSAVNTVAKRVALATVAQVCSSIWIRKNSKDGKEKDGKSNESRTIKVIGGF